MPILFGLTLMQIVALIPEAIKIIQAGQAVYKILVDVHKVASDQAVQQSMSVVGKALGKLLYDTIGVAVPVPHRMTPEEEELWFQRMTPDASSGGG